MLTKEHKKNDGLLYRFFFHFLHYTFFFLTKARLKYPYFFSPYTISNKPFYMKAVKNYWLKVIDHFHMKNNSIYKNNKKAIENNLI